MNKTIINVPKGINFLSEWKEFRLFDYPYILNKQITGCGFTEFCLTCNANIILCSPRRILLENKEDGYIERQKKYGNLGYKLFYARNNFETLTNYDKDLTASKKVGKSIENLSEEDLEVRKEFSYKYKQSIKDFYYSCQGVCYCKILVTYDSFRKVKEALDELGIFEDFYVVVDEFQSIFTDSKFKPNTELEFVNILQSNSKLCYASATPMIEKYLDQLDEFKDLPYYELDWGAEDPYRVTIPKIKSTPCSKLLRKAYEIVEKYRTDRWRESDNNIKRLILDGNIQEIRSKEAIFYMNSVKNICNIIKTCDLKQEECNILCADTPENREKIRKAFKVTKSDFQGLGKVYKESEMDKNKMFTFCTRTVYLGADFWSNNARTFIFSDANSKTMAVDITLDLPQILGRQRNENNPWKDEAEIYYLTTKDDKKQTSEEFNEILKQKYQKTTDLLSAYSTSISDKVKISLSDTYEKVAIAYNYESDYISVNRHEGKLPIPVLNKLVMLSEIREFEIRQIDYADRFSIRSTINSRFGIVENKLVSDFIKEFENRKYFQEKLKFLCEFLETENITEDIKDEILYKIDDYYSNYYKTLGPIKLKSLFYRREKIDEELNRLINNQSLDPSELIYAVFQEGNKYSKAYIKEKLKELYASINYKRTAKATDIEEYFLAKSVNYMENGKKTHGFELIKKK